MKHTPLLVWLKYLPRCGVHRETSQNTAGWLRSVALRPGETQPHTVTAPLLYSKVLGYVIKVVSVACNTLIRHVILTHPVNLEQI